MFLILSNISFQELTEKPDLKKYVCDCDYFSLIRCLDKKELLQCMDGWVTWYSLFHTEPLYITVISDKDWFCVAGNMQNSVKTTTWKNTPKYIEEAKNYSNIPNEDRIIRDADMSILIEKIKNHNIKDKPFVICLPNK